MAQATEFKTYQTSEGWGMKNGKLVDFECATSFEKALAVLDRLYDRN